MMKHMSLAEIATACGGTYVGDDSLKTVEVNGVVIDSRKVEPGYLFVAVKGERVDGHTFIPSVFAKGAACVLCEDAPEQPAGAEQQQRRDGQHVKPRRKLGLGVHIDFSDAQLRPGLGQCVQHRRKRTARATPRGKEVYEHRPFGLQDLLLEIFFRQR